MASFYPSFRSIPTASVKRQAQRYNLSPAIAKEAVPAQDAWSASLLCGTTKPKTKVCWLGLRRMSCNNKAMELVRTMTESEAPTYKNPPVIETLLGLQFEILPGLKNAHLGAFWATLGPEWTKVSDMPASPPEFERFGDDQILGQLGAIRFSMVQLDGAPPMRVRAEKIDGDQMTQVQNGRIFFNWKKAGTAAYPHYAARKLAFCEIFEKFQQFVKGSGLGDLILNQWEITYVNHLPKGSVWNTPSDWSELFSPIAQLSPELGFVDLESFGGERHYIIPPKRGRLHVQLQHARTPKGKETNAQEVLILKLTARGPMTPEQGRDPFAFGGGLDLGHDVIRKSFEHLTSQAARDYWRK
jgi:uncharacterized protein (TIGR04255 family)